MKNLEKEHLLKEQVLSYLGDYFNIEVEKTGHYFTNEPIRCDLLLTPKQKTIDMGLKKDDLIVVELKDPEDGDSLNKLMDGCAQAHSYNQSRYDNKVPIFSVIYPPFEEFFKHRESNGSPDRPLDQSNHLALQYFRRLLQRFNIGELNCNLDYYGNPMFEFLFSGQYFFSSKKGRTAVKGIGIKRYIGSKTRQNLYPAS